MPRIEDALLGELEDHEVARIDALARRYEVTREFMLAAIVRSGLVHVGILMAGDDAPPDSDVRVRGGAA